MPIYHNIPVRTASHVAEPESARTWSFADRIRPLPLIDNLGLPGEEKYANNMNLHPVAHATTLLVSDILNLRVGL